MKAMILAAGYGSRLKPLTDVKPKALIEIHSTTLLEFVIRKLIAAGVTEIIINTHHFADQIVDYVQKHDRFGIHVEFSHESEILGTGGGLKKARRFFDDDKPFILHNVDILSTIDLQQMVHHHSKRGALATLAVQQRQTSRYFIVDDQNMICGHEDQSNKRTRLKRKPDGASHLKAFCGIHVLSPEIFNHIDETGRFSIVDVYLNLIEQGFPIIAYPADDAYWQDIGKLETLQKIQQDFQSGIIHADLLMK